MHAKKNYPNVLQLILSLPLMAIVLMGSFGLIMLWMSPNVESLSSLSLFLGYSLGFGLVFVTLYLLSGLRPIQWSDWNGEGLGIIVLATLLMIPARLPIVQLMPISEELMQQFEDLIVFDIWGFLTICIAAALLEELIFRGVILEGLLRNYGQWKAIIISSIVFGLAHFNPVQFISAGILGLFIGWIYSRTRSVLPGICIHFINNCIPFIVGWYADRNGLDDIGEANPSYVYVLIGGIFCTILCLPLLRTLQKILPAQPLDGQAEMGIIGLDQQNIS